MELVEGEDLSERINRGPIPPDEAIPIALQIADALEAAHEAGIVHRDLKPANIKLTENGTVKVLDFGLAKAWESDGGDSSISMSPTMTRNATMEGVILGTAAYMSPEQARGKKVDRRADVWSFGVVLWEMLTGRKLFEGETVSDVLAAVLRAEIPWDQLPQSTPFAVERLLRRCLARDPERRLRDMGDAGLELREPSEPQPQVREENGYARLADPAVDRSDRRTGHRSVGDWRGFFRPVQWFGFDLAAKGGVEPLRARWSCVRSEWRPARRIARRPECGLSGTRTGRTALCLRALT